MAYVVAAYAVLWAVSFGLVFSMVWRQRKLQAQLHMLHQIVDSEPAPQK